MGHGNLLFARAGEYESLKYSCCQLLEDARREDNHYRELLIAQALAAEACLHSGPTGPCILLALFRTKLTEQQDSESRQ